MKKEKQLSKSSIVTLMITLMISFTILINVINGVTNVLIDSYKGTECNGFECFEEGYYTTTLLIIFSIPILILFLVSLIVLLKSGMSSLIKNKKIKIVINIIPIMLVLIFILYPIIKVSQSVEKQKDLINKSIEDAQKYLINKYDMDNQKLKYASVIPSHKVKYCSGECITSESAATIPTIVKFSYEGELISVSNNQDDYLVDDLYNEIRKYYSKKLSIDISNVFLQNLSDNNYEYVEYLNKNHITKVNSNLVEEFLSKIKGKITIYITIKNDNEETKYVENIKNNYSNLLFDEKINLYNNRQVSFRVKEEYDDVYDSLWGDNDYLQFKYYISEAKTKLNPELYQHELYYREYLLFEYPQQ